MFQDTDFDEMYYTVDNLVEYFPTLKKIEGSLDMIIKEKIKLEKMERQKIDSTCKVIFFFELGT